ncbi:MAG TPA: DUF2815 domain-containing protein [Lachnospiraceae bacterium]|nr:DUF2815 domain-containing protein [Lachnospiraceae bacterium]
MAHVVTGKARLSYPSLFKARAFAGQDAKYSCVLLIPKTDKATVAKIREAIEITKQDDKDKWRGKIPASLRTPLRDGDVEKADEHPEYAGMWFMSVSSKNPPKIYDRDRSELMDPEELYPGCWVRADINFAGYSNSGNNGIGAYINSVMKWADAERFAGYSASANAYDDDYEDTDEDLM